MYNIEPFPPKRTKIQRKNGMILRHLRVNTIMLPGRETTYLRIPGKSGIEWE